MLRRDGSDDSSCFHVDSLEVYRDVLVAVTERMSINRFDREHYFVQVYDQRTCVSFALQLSLDLKQTVVCSLLLLCIQQLSHFDFLPLDPILPVNTIQFACRNVNSWMSTVEDLRTRLD